MAGCDECKACCHRTLTGSLFILNLCLMAVGVGVLGAGAVLLFESSGVAVTPTVLASGGSLMVALGASGIVVEQCGMSRRWMWRAYVGGLGLVVLSECAFVILLLIPPVRRQVLRDLSPRGDQSDGAISKEEVFWRDHVGTIAVLGSVLLVIQSMCMLVGYTFMSTLPEKHGFQKIKPSTTRVVKPGSTVFAASAAEVEEANTNPFTRADRRGLDEEVASF